MIYTAFLLFLTALQPSVNHAIYISIVEINYSSTTKLANLQVKVFTDDLQDVLRNYSADYVAQPKEAFISNNRQLVEEYFNSNLKMEVNGELLLLKFDEARAEGDAHFLSFSLPNSQITWKSLKIEGQFFTELFPDQSNILNLKVDEKKYFARLTKANPNYTFTFD